MELNITEESGDVPRELNSKNIEEDNVQVVQKNSKDNTLSSDQSSLNSAQNCDEELHKSFKNNEKLNTDGPCNMNIPGTGSSVEKSNEGIDLYDKSSYIKNTDLTHEASGEVQIRKRRQRNSDSISSPEMVDHVKDIEVSAPRPIYTKTQDFSLLNYLKMEVTRSYLFEEQETKYTEQMEKVYTFMKTPRELEKLMWFGFLLCLDCFLFVFTYLPIRLFIALFKLFANVLCLRFLKNGYSLLESYYMCDLLRGFILIVCCTALDNVDLSILYHIVRGQSVIKLYVIYNMLDIADRLFSSIGQDTLDALFSTAAEPKERRSVLMVLLHFGFASVYVYLHAVLVLFQAITLNVAINSHNKVLMVVMISNQFVELKGSVFKKFEKNNLFQMSCADIRERFYYVVLVLLVALRNMHELQWDLDHLYTLMPSIGSLLCSEIFVDWVKHAFITKFNSISSEVYREYRELLAFDATTSRLFEQRACSDHFDLVSRRLGFIPLPLGCLVYRVTSQSVNISGRAGVIVLVLAYLWLTSLKVLTSIILLGLSCRYVNKDKKESKDAQGEDRTIARPSPSRHVVSDPLDKGSKKKSSVTHEVKTLNEIDRYTLCSNRIV